MRVEGSSLVRMTFFFFFFLRVNGFIKKNLTTKRSVMLICYAIFTFH